MAYASPAQFIQAFGQIETIELSALENAAATTVNSAVVQRALTDASGTMDSYFWRYSLPFETPPATLVGYCLDIARHRLDRVREREDVRRRYEDAIKWLELVAKGTVRLGVDADGAAVAPDAPSGGQVWGLRPDRAYTNQSLNGYMNGNLSGRRY
jgi:phage gp36-like protein